MQDRSILSSREHLPAGSEITDASLEKLVKILDIPESYYFGFVLGLGIS